MSLKALEEHYELRDVLGRGGFGTVYRARHRRLQREVALKVLHAKGDRTRFVREGQILARLRHPNIVEVFDCGILGDTAYLAFELVEGETLTSLLGRGPLSGEETNWVLQELLSGLAVAHADGIWHRDVKLDNVLIAKAAGTTTLKLLDFGIAKDTFAENLTAEGSLLGTARYLAPEMLHGTPGSALTDLWAVGILAFECLTATPAYPGVAPDIYREILAGPPPALQHLGGTPLGQVLLRLLAPAEHRPKTVSEALLLLRMLPKSPIGSRRVGHSTLLGTVAALPEASLGSTKALTVPAKRALPKKGTPPLPILGIAIAFVFAVLAGALGVFLWLAPEEDDSALVAATQPQFAAPAQTIAPASTAASSPDTQDEFGAPPTKPEDHSPRQIAEAEFTDPVDTSAADTHAAETDTHAAETNTHAAETSTHPVDTPAALTPEPERASAARSDAPTSRSSTVEMPVDSARASARRRRRAPTPVGVVTPIGSPPPVGAPPAVGAPRAVRATGPICQGSDPQINRRWQQAIRCALRASGETAALRVHINADGSFHCAPSSDLCHSLRACRPPQGSGTTMQCFASSNR